MAKKGKKQKAGVFRAAPAPHLEGTLHLIMRAVGAARRSRLNGEWPDARAVTLGDNAEHELGSALIRCIYSRLLSKID